MSVINSRARGRLPNRPLLRLLAYIPPLMLAAPIVFLLAKSLGLSRDLLWHVSSTLLPDALLQTALMLAGVVGICMLLGFGSAWILARFEFRFASFWRWAILLPLSLPAYVVSFVWISWLDYSGLVPTWLRNDLGASWTSMFSNFRSLSGLFIPVSLALFPYMYLLIFEGLDTQSRNLSDAARSLGLRRVRRFFKLDLPLLLPWIASGILLVGMETLADFGSVSIFNLNVFTTVVYRSWFGLQSIETASFFAVIHILCLILFVSAVLKYVKRKKYIDPYAGRMALARRELRGLKMGLANLFLGVLWLLSFLLPVIQLLAWSLKNPGTFFDARLWERALNSFWISGAAALVATLFALIILVAHRFVKNSDIDWIEKISSLGYGIPGTVIAVGWMAAITSLWGSLHLNPSVAVLALVVGLATRFMALAQRPVMSASAKISASVEESSQSCGAGTWHTFRHVHFPLFKHAFLIGFLFVFIDTLKEMPMTLLMRPFGWDTLAVRVYQYTSDSMWREASTPALLIVVASVIPIFLMRRRVR